MNLTNQFRSGRGQGVDASKARFVFLVLLVAACAILGGSSRSDVVVLPVLRSIAVVCLIFSAMLATGNFRDVRAPLVLLALLAVSIACQLVPLPVSWTPRADLLAYAPQLVEAGQWAPISLAPDRTWNSLIALIIPLAMLVCLSGLLARPGPILVIVVATALASSLLGILQVAGGKDSFFYLYENMHRGLPTGFLANRNHQAALLAVAIPVLWAWAADTKRSRLGVSNAMIAGALSLFFAMVILITGSRSGILMLFVAILATMLSIPSVFPARMPKKMRLSIGVAGVAISLFLVLLTFYLGRAYSIDRLMGINNLNEEARLSNAPIMIEMFRDFLPFGSGFGSFDQMFRMAEVDAALKLTYFNNAHNDLLEIGITGGAPALLAVLAFILWWGWSSWRVFRTRAPGAFNSAARAGSIGIFIFLLASLTDYPLRTPLLGAVFALLSAMLAKGCVEAAGARQPRLQLSR